MMIESDRPNKKEFQIKQKWQKIHRNTKARMENSILIGRLWRRKKNRSKSKIKEKLRLLRNQIIIEFCVFVRCIFFISMLFPFFFLSIIVICEYSIILFHLTVFFIVFMFYCHVFFFCFLILFESFFRSTRTTESILNNSQQK